MCVYVQLCLVLHDPMDYSLSGPLSVEFPRQEFWSGLPFSVPGDLLDSWLKLHLLQVLHWQADSLPLHHQGSPGFAVATCYDVPCSQRPPDFCCVLTPHQHPKLGETDTSPFCTPLKSLNTGHMLLSLLPEGEASACSPAPNFIEPS